MRADWYTKLVLTVIAACLLWISVGGPSLMTPLRAQERISGYERVIIAGWLDYGGQEHRIGVGTVIPGTGIPVHVDTEK